MKRLFYFILYLNIYAGFLHETNAQKLHLIIEAEKPVSENVIDSLNTNTGNGFEDYLSLKREVDSLHFKLQNIGYIDNELKSFQKKNDSSYVAIYYFGLKYKFIKIYYSEFDFSKKELTAVSSEITGTYFILPFSEIETSLQKLNILKTNNGNAFARLHLEQINKNNNTLSAKLVLQGGKKRIIDHIIVKGYDKFPKSFLKYYTGIKKGAPFSIKKIIKQSEALNTLGFVSNIKPPEALFKKDSTTVYFYLKKQKNNLFDGVLGFATNEDTKKLVFNGYLNLELNNNLNFGEQFLLNYKADGNDQQSFRVKIDMPYLLKSPIGLGLELKIFKQDSTFITTDQSARASYQINPATNTHIGYKGYDSSSLLNQEGSGNLIEDYKSQFFIAGISYKKLQNNLLFPIKTNISLNTEIGSRKKAIITTSQFKVSALLLHIFNLNYKNSIYLRSNTRFFKSDAYLINELYRFGGTNSIRGFNENSIDASFYSVLNSEYRYQFNKGVYMYSIIDIAYFENQAQQISNKLYSFGIGTGLQTKAGLLNFSIANGNAENQYFNFSNTKIHISILSQF